MLYTMEIQPTLMEEIQAAQGADPQLKMVKGGSVSRKGTWVHNL